MRSLEDPLLVDPLFLRRLVTCFLVALASYCFVYGFELTHFTLSIDEEPLDNFAQTLSAGRWGHALLKRHLLPEPYLPFFTTALSLLLLSLAAAVTAVQLRLDRVQASSFVVMLAALPQLAYQLEFANQADTVAISLLCSAASVAFLQGRRLMHAVVFVVLTVAALSIYQSTFLYAASLICIRLVMASVDGSFSRAAALRSIVRYAALTAVALVVNLLAAKAVAGHYGVAISGYLSSMIGWGKAPSTEVVRVVWIFVREHFSFQTYYGMNAFAFSALWAAGAVACAIRYRHHPVRTGIFCLVALGSTFVLPAVLGMALPPRTMTQAPLVFAGLFAAFVVTSRRSRMGMGIALVFLVVGAAASSRLFFSDQMARQADRQLASQIVDALYARYPSFDMARVPVFFYGSYTPHTPWKVPRSDVFGASFFDWDGGNNSRMYRYLSTANIIALQRPSPEQVAAASEAGKSLPSWPDRNSIQLSNDVVIVKLSNVLSPHNR